MLLGCCNAMDKHYLLPLLLLSLIYNLIIVSRADFVKGTSNYTSNFEQNVVDLHAQFKEFVVRFNKSYLHESMEYTKRKRIFKESLIRQYKLNQNEKQLGGSAVYGVNKFSDLTPREFKEFLRKSHVRPSLGAVNSLENPKSTLCDIPQKQMPTHWNWHEKGKITPIKNQGKCGSCWAFTAVEITESQWAIKTGEVKQLSVQELISCGAGEGCQGGNTCQALYWMIQKYNNQTIDYYTLAPESECPYEDKQTECNDHLKHCKQGVTIKQPCCRYHADEINYIKPVVAFVGTVAVNVDATLWHDYLSGIIQHHCSGLDINHAVQIVGFDTTGVVPYWIVRNSWGTDFGDKGYLYIEMGKNLCGVTSEVTFVIV